MIQLLFDWNLAQTYNPQTNWTIKVIKILHDKYGIDELNVVGHSWGGTEFLHALGQSKWIQRNVKFNKVVLMGTPVNEGVTNKVTYSQALRAHLTDAEYRKLKEEYQSLTPCSPIKFYNVMADYHDHTDTSVPNVQSEFLASILNPKWSSCKITMFYGIKHSALHQDPKVLMRVAKMLYD